MEITRPSIQSAEVGLTALVAATALVAEPPRLRAVPRPRPHPRAGGARARASACLIFFAHARNGQAIMDDREYTANRQLMGFMGDDGLPSRGR